MLTTSLLAATLLLQTSTPADFDGLKLKLVSTPKEPVMNGPTKSWEGSSTSMLFGRESTTIVYGLSVTDFKGLAAKPTEDRVFGVHELQARGRKPFAAQNFRKSMATIGGHKMLILNGSVIAPNSGGQPTSSYWVSFVFVAGDKAYEYNQISVFETDSREALQRISEMRLKEGESEVAPSGVPKDAKGEYTLRGIPFILTTSRVPSPSTTTPRDPAFGDGQYTGVMVDVKGPQILYKLREVKADEKRTDAQIFRELVDSFVKVRDTPEEKFAIKDGSGTVDFEYRDGDKDYVAHARFERDGKWVAVLVGYVEKAQADKLKETTLRRMPEDE